MDKLLKQCFNSSKLKENNLEPIFAVYFKDSVLVVTRNIKLIDTNNFGMTEYTFPNCIDNDLSGTGVNCISSFYTLDIVEFLNAVCSGKFEFIKCLYCKERLINNKYRQPINDLFNFVNVIVSENDRNILDNMYMDCAYLFERFKRFMICLNKNVQRDSRYIPLALQLVKIFRYGCIIDGYVNKDIIFEKCFDYNSGLVDVLENRIRTNDIKYSELIEMLSNTFNQMFTNISKLPQNNKTDTVFLYLTNIYNNIILSDKTVNNIDISKYDNIWFTSDLHFGHSNILNFENRHDIGKYHNISDINIHDKALIDNWNSVVGNNDLVFILGDFSFKGALDTTKILCSLNGHKVLIKGNHDHRFLDKHDFNKDIFIMITDYLEINYNDMELILMHYPILSFKHMNRPDKPAIHLFGHLHSRDLNIPKHSYNVGVDVNNFKPVNIKDCIQRALNNGGMSNEQFNN